MLVPGDTFNGRFQIIRCIKAGGMGAVYEVLHLETQRKRALKTMLPELISNSAYRERFRREATVAANVDSDHIVEVFDAGIDEHTKIPFILMELLRGEELGEALLRRGRFEPLEVVQLVHQAGRALERAHAAGIVHRDLKPENMFLAKRADGTQRLKLLDFGIAKLRGESSATGHTTLGIGSPLYMAPEQIRGQSKLGPAADTYALANIAFTLLCGEAYWDDMGKKLGSVYSLLLAKTGQEECPAASVRAAALGVSLSVEFDAWFARATAQRPEQRFQSAAHLVEELAAVLGVPPNFEQQRSRVTSVPPAEPDAFAVSAIRALPRDEREPRALPRSNTDRAVTKDVGSRTPRRRLGAAALAVAVMAVAIAVGSSRHRLFGPAASASSRSGMRPSSSTFTLQSLRAPETHALAPSAGPRQAAAATVTLEIRVVPAHASIVLDGRPVANPSVVQLPADGRSHALRASAPRHVSETHTFAADHSQQIALTLKPESKRAPVEPRRALVGTAVPETSVKPAPQELPDAAKADCRHPFFLDREGIKRFRSECE